MDEAKMARTESAFREVNEAIARTARRSGAAEAHFVCECYDLECAERVPLGIAEYDALRADATRFLLVPGHHAPGYERVLDRSDSHETVEKLGSRMRRIARRLDPRARPQPEIT
jgi:hypothetical protein